MDYKQLALSVHQSQNQVRTNPRSFIPKLEAMLPYFDGTLYRKPGKIPLRTSEGAEAVKECIEFLRSANTVHELSLHEGIVRACEDHVNDIGPKGSISHSGSDGSSFSERMERYGDWMGNIGENCDFGGESGDEIVISLIVDDGNRSRGHRKNMFNPKFNHVGIGCARHQDCDHCCVIDYASEYNPKGQKGEGSWDANAKLDNSRLFPGTSFVQSQASSGPQGVNIGLQNPTLQSQTSFGPQGVNIGLQNPTNPSNITDPLKKSPTFTYNDFKSDYSNSSQQNAPYTRTYTTYTTNTNTNTNTNEPPRYESTYSNPTSSNFNYGTPNVQQTNDSRYTTPSTQYTSDPRYGTPNTQTTNDFRYGAPSGQSNSELRFEGPRSTNDFRYETMNTQQNNDPRFGHLMSGVLRNSGLSGQTTDPTYNYGVEGRTTEPLHRSGYGGQSAEPLHRSGYGGQNTEPLHRSGYGGQSNEPLRNSGFVDSNASLLRNSGVGSQGTNPLGNSGIGARVTEPLRKSGVGPTQNNSNYETNESYSTTKTSSHSSTQGAFPTTLFNSQFGKQDDFFGSFNKDPSDEKVKTSFETKRFGDSDLLNDPMIAQHLGKLRIQSEFSGDNLRELARKEAPPGSNGWSVDSVTEIKNGQKSTKVSITYKFPDGSTQQIIKEFLEGA